MHQSNYTIYICQNTYIIIYIYYIRQNNYTIYCGKYTSKQFSSRFPCFNAQVYSIAVLLRILAAQEKLGGP